MNDKVKFKEMQDTYEDIQKSLNVPGLKGLGGLDPFLNLPDLPDRPKDKDEPKAKGEKEKK